jgi:hypothetical protein
LTNVKLIKKILKTSPTNSVLGFVKGYLYEITDETEPNGIFRYPILIQDNTGGNIPAQLTQFEITKKELTVIYNRLNEFEGHLYKPKEMIFYGVNGKKFKGIAFVAKSVSAIIKNANIEKIPLQNNTN